MGEPGAARGQGGRHGGMGMAGGSALRECPAAGAAVLPERETSLVTRRGLDGAKAPEVKSVHANRISRI